MCVSFDTITIGSDAWLVRFTVVSGKDERHALPAAHRRRRGELGVRVIDLPLWEPVEQLVQRNAAFEPREVRAEAVVQSEPEREVLDVGATDLVDVGLLVAARVP